jgi:hypothetical protein
VASFGSWPAFVDWDADGDQDLLIGSFGGELFLRTNVGAPKKPEWAPEAVRVEAAGSPFKVNAHAAPAVADWNGDGLFDLVVGASDGSVQWFKNEGAKGKPRFGAARTLVAARSTNKFLQRFVEPGEAPQSGVRAQIAVVDYDLDGKLDLLVGDYADVTELRKLTVEERLAFRDLVAAREALLARLRAETEDKSSRDALMKEYEAFEAKLKPFFADPAKDGARKSYVWLFLRTDTDNLNSIEIKD